MKAEEDLQKLDEDSHGLLEEVIYNPGIVDKLVGLFKKVLQIRNTSELDQKMKQNIITKFKMFFKGFKQGTPDYHILNLLKLIQKLYENNLVTKNYINEIIDVIKSFESSSFVRPYLNILEKVVDSLDSNVFGGNNEMSSSGEWSDFDSSDVTTGVSR